MRFVAILRKALWEIGDALWVVLLLVIGLPIVIFFLLGAVLPMAFFMGAFSSAFPAASLVFGLAVGYMLACRLAHRKPFPPEIFSYLAAAGRTYWLRAANFASYALRSLVP